MTNFVRFRSIVGIASSWRGFEGFRRALAAGSCILQLLTPSMTRAAPEPFGDAPAKRGELKELVKASSLGVPSEEIARMNLLCAERLAGAENVDVPACLSYLDEWTKRVRAETARHQYQFKRNPSEFENSEGFYKMLMLAVVLAEDFRVRYRADRRIDPSAASDSDGFFADSRDVFLHGLLGPERRGTCSSLPVLYVAIGRRLGYPLKLVTTKGHLFVRWEGDGERFNIEAAGEGLNRFDDNYYRRWPFPITVEEEQAEGYLKSLGPSEELAVFLSVRVQCLRASKRLKEAAETQEHVCRLMPNSKAHRKILEQLQRESVDGAITAPATRRTNNLSDNKIHKTRTLP